MLDVAIIGAGAAGLGAAKAAISRGLTFKVLEAASYIGGRARTDTHSLGVPFDLCCHSLYGGEDNPLQTFASEIGSRLEPVPAIIAFHDGARFLDSAETHATISNFERLETDLISAHESSLNTSDIPESSQASAIDADNPSVAYFRQAMHMEFTAAAADISLTDPLHGVLATVGAAALDGYGALILRAAADVPVVIDCPVTAIDLSGRQVVLETSKGQIDDRVFFAGEACSPDHPGTAHGAWLSGRAAIERIAL